MAYSIKSSELRSSSMPRRVDAIDMAAGRQNMYFSSFIAGLGWLVFYGCLVVVYYGCRFHIVLG